MAEFDPLEELFSNPSQRVISLAPRLRKRYETDQPAQQRRTALVQGTGYVGKHQSDGALRSSDPDLSEEPSECGYENKKSIYPLYDFRTRNPGPTLGITTIQDDLVQLLDTQQVVIIKGFTGCGKTTQVPQYILDHSVKRNIGCNIVVTQPRRIAATSVARRVCAERNWQLGTIVGYQIGMEPKVSTDTCLTYVTTGCLLEKIIADKSLNSFSHIVIDEVHERDEDTDLLMVIVRKLLFRTQTNTKVILMSATIDTSKLASYFTQSVVPAVLSVEVPRMFEVSVNYLEHLSNVGPLPPLDVDKPEINPTTYEFAAMLIMQLDVSEVRIHGPQPNASFLSQSRGAVLVFLPGLLEIETMDKTLQKLESMRGSSCKLRILPLHSRITSEEQRMIFEPVPAGWRKVILSTNVAESSITVPDIQYVVDFCLMKQLVADEGTSFCTLKTEWAPKSNLVQREGRVGRVSSGTVFRLITKKMFSQLPVDVTPEILRCPLEHTILRAKVLDMGTPEAILANAMDPPDLSNVARTVATLKEVGALYLTSNGVVDPCDGDLTYIGRVVSKLPIDVHLGKLIVLGHIFNVLEEAVIIAAGLGSKSIFTSPYRDRLAAYKAKLLWADGSFCDCIALLNAYRVWENMSRKGQFLRSGSSAEQREKEWARRNFIQLAAMKEMHFLIGEIEARLRGEGIRPVLAPNMAPLSDTKKSLILKFVIFGAFYPQLLCHKPFMGTEDERDEAEREAIRVVGGFDPCNTVALGGFPLSENGKLYTNQIRDLFHEFGSNIVVRVDHSKVFVQFAERTEPSDSKSVLIPGRIHRGVYFALKMRMLRLPLNLRLIRQTYSQTIVDDLESRMKDLMTSENDGDSDNLESRAGLLPRHCQLPPPDVPAVNVSEMALEVSYSEDPSHFWVQKMEPSSRAALVYVIRLANDRSSLIPLGTQRPYPGALVLAPYQEEYFRAVVRHVTTSGVAVYFLDYGNTELVGISLLRQFPRELLRIPPLALECTLTGVGPSQLLSDKGLWSDRAIEWFKSVAEGKVFTGVIYSVVGSVVSLDLCAPGQPERSMTRSLLQNGFAEVVEESYVSRKNHVTRTGMVGVDKVSLPSCDSLFSATSQLRQAAAEEAALELIRFSDDMYGDSIQLKGPHSPLEIKMYGRCKGLELYKVNVESGSVNSVLLDQYITDRRERILVAAQIGISSGGSTASARNTTLLPAINGLPALLSLIFAPAVEIRMHPSRTHMTGALCGLGYDPVRHEPAFGEHDMEVVFDSEITPMDLVNVNKIRHEINKVIGGDAANGYLSVPSDRGLLQVQKNILDLMFQLLSTERKPLETIYEPRKKYAWNIVPKEYLIPVSSPPRSVLSMISGVRLLAPKSN